MKQGDLIMTTMGAGRIAYVRMKPPVYSTPEAVSVVLDKRRNDPGYTGTIFAAADVRVINKPTKENGNADV